MSTQLPLIFERTNPKFDGETYNADVDGARLFRQLSRVRTFMRSGEWRTLAEISAAVGSPEASVSARLRDLRKEKFGGYLVERRRRGLAARGLWEYRLGVTRED